MKAHAVVIGIDAYANAAWNLEGAVGDAIGFAAWALKHGGVAEADLTLLLAPDPADPLPPRLAAAGIGPGVTPGVPTKDRLEQVFLDYETGFGKDADRLWFFYAGHGVAPAAGGPDAGPVIVPCDQADLTRYLRFSPLALETWRRFMSAQLPRTQVFFVDACREVLDSSAPAQVTQQLVWDIPRVSTESTQAVFFAAAAGQKARELYESGIFGKALRTGLQGRGPKLADPNPALDPQRVRLQFDALAAFVRQRVAEAARNLGFGTGTGGQDARGQLTGPDPALTVTTFAPDQVPTATMTVIVEPAAAHAKGTVEVVRWDADSEAWLPRKRPPPVAPLLPPVRLVASVGEHVLRVRSPGYQWVLRPVELAEDTSVRIDLVPDDGLEAVAPQLGTVKVVSSDALARITLSDFDGKELEAASPSRWTVPAGGYCVTVDVPGRGRVDRRVEVLADVSSEEEVELGAMPSAHPLEALLQPMGIGVDPQRGVFYPAEGFGPVATPRLGSFLAYSAWAARWPHGALWHLRQAGVESARPAAGNGALQVLVGDADGGLRTADVYVDGVGLPLFPLALSPLAQTLFAQASWEGAPRAYGVVVYAHEDFRLGPLRIPVVLVEGFVSVLVVVREPDDRVEIHQYLQPSDPTVPLPGDVQAPPIVGVRLAEMAWRALDERRPVRAEDLRQLGAAGRFDPFATLAVGFRMVIDGKAAELLEHTVASGAPLLGELLRCYPGIPDVHVLAALSDPEHAAAHFDRAAALGVPVFGYAAQALLDHLFGRGDPLPELRRAPVPGATWTVLVDCEDDGVTALRGATGMASPEVMAPALDAVRRGVAMPVSGAAVRVGERVAVAGRTATAVEGPSPALAWLFRDVPAGEVVLAAGRVVAVSDGAFEHDCPTVEGMRGGPVVSLRTGEVVGIQESGRRAKTTIG